jgi:hypothetical protein
MFPFLSLWYSPVPTQALALASAGKLKKVDVGTAAALVTQLHRAYPNFTELLREALKPQLKLLKTDDKDAAANCRVSLRLFTELVVTGVFAEADLVAVGANIKRILVFDA